LCALPIASAQAQASDFTTEPVATAYWHIPLGATRAGNEHPSFGLRMDHVARDNQGVSFFNPTQTPVVDFRFNASGMQGMYVRGINMATPDIMKLGMADIIVFGIATGVIVATAVIDMNNNDSPVNNCTTLALNTGCVGFSGSGFNWVSCCR
jgi:hypothetical protein